MIISGKSFYLELNFRRILGALLNKFLYAILRVLDILRYMPVRLTRLAEHFAQGIKVLNVDKVQPQSTGKALIRISNWWLEFFMMILDCLGFSELYETLFDFIKINTRGLQDWEKELAVQIFGNSINYSRVRLDEYAIAGPKQKKICYVSFYLINSWGRMQNSLLLHELMHVWQYQKLGIVYIPRALKAQFIEEGYNYGGEEYLRRVKNANRGLEAFNLEQQAEIVSDYYLIRNGYQPRWGNGTLADLPVYEYFIAQLRT